MQLYLIATLDRLRVDVEYFFRMAYIWRFGKPANVHEDAVSWRIHGILPDYAVKYLLHLQGERHEVPDLIPDSAHVPVGFPREG